MKPRIFTTAFSKVYQLLVQKAEKKGSTKEEVDKVICLPEIERGRFSKCQEINRF